MKTLFRYLFYLAIVSLLFSCQNTDEFGGELTGIELKKAVKGEVITVLPSGGDDTDNLKQAFADAAIAGPGTTIQLVEGEYFCNYIEVYGFQGSLLGAGPDKTQIKLYGIIDIGVQTLENKLATWWRMIGGDIVISGMSFILPDGVVTEGDDFLFGPDLGMILIFNNYNDEYQNQENPQSLVLTNVNFYGGYDNGEGLWGTTDNVIVEVWVGMECYWPDPSLEYPLTKGNYLIENCKFKKAIDAIEGFGLGKDATLKINSCYFDEFYGPLYFTANYSSIYINDNTFVNTTWCDLLLEDNDWGILNSEYVDPTYRCRYSVKGNKFNHSFPVTAIISNDHWFYTNPEERPPMLISIRNNEFNLVDGSTGLSLNNTQDAMVKNNRFKGICQTGVAVDGFSWLDPDNPPFAKNVLILGNNLSNLNSVTNIYLGEKSMDCTVVGSKSDGAVVDNGVNNIISGMKPGKNGLKLGPSVSDNHHLLKRIHK